MVFLVHQQLQGVLLIGIVPEVRKVAAGCQTRFLESDRLNAQDPAL